MCPSRQGKCRRDNLFAPDTIELTTTVLWLNKIGLDITCIRLKPYNLDGQVIMDIQQLMPLPEAEEYETKIREQQQERRLAETSRPAILRRFWRQLIVRSRPKTTLFSNRTGTLRNSPHASRRFESVSAQTNPTATAKARTPRYTLAVFSFRFSPWQ
jgi:hypothetical protein